MAGAQVIKAFGQEDVFMAKYLKLQNQLAISGMVMGSCSNWYQVRMGIVKCYLKLLGFLMCIANKGTIENITLILFFH